MGGSRYDWVDDALWFALWACVIAVIGIALVFMFDILAGASEKLPKVKFKVVSADRKQIVLRPVLAVDLFGYLRDNSDVPATSQMLTCEPGTESTATIADAYGKPTTEGISILTLDCGAVSLRVGGINF